MTKSRRRKRPHSQCNQKIYLDVKEYSHPSPNTLEADRHRIVTPSKIQVVVQKSYVPTLRASLFLHSPETKTIQELTGTHVDPQGGQDLAKASSENGETEDEALVNESSPSFVMTDMNQNDMQLDVETAATLLKEKDLEIESLKRVLEERRLENETLKRQNCEQVIEIESLKARLVACKEQDEDLTFKTPPEKISQLLKFENEAEISPSACSTPSSKKRRGKKKSKLNQKSSRKQLVIKDDVEIVDSSTCAADLTQDSNASTVSIFKSVESSFNQEVTQNESNYNQNESELLESSIESDVKEEPSNLHPITVSPSTSFLEHSDLQPMSAPAIMTTTCFPPKRNEDICKYGKFLQKQEGIMKVNFDYPQTVHTCIEAKMFDLNNIYKPEEMVLFPMYNKFRVSDISPIRKPVKNMDNDMTNKTCLDRHEPHENQEKLRKKWADNRDRQIELHEQLMKRQKVSAYDILGIAEPEQTFVQDVQQIEEVEVSNSLPVSAFGANISQIKCESFSLSWFNAKKYKPPAKLKNI